MNSADLWPIVKAHAEGKQIQYRGGAGHNWEDVEHPGWNPCAEYRIAPEPKVRPWTMEEVPVGKVVRMKEGGVRAVIAYMSGDKIHAGFYEYNPQELLEYATMDDGSPCGVVCE